MALSQFEVVTLFVPDIAASRSFYERVFGVEVIYSDAVSAVFGFAGTMVNLLSDREASTLVAPLPPELGVTLLNGPLDRPWGRRTAAFADPAGHVWELAQEI